MIKSITNFLYILSSLNLKYLKLTKMDITRFAMKLFSSDPYSHYCITKVFHPL